MLTACTPEARSNIPTQEPTFSQFIHRFDSAGINLTLKGEHAIDVEDYAS
jgi:hypothetical protein